MLWLSLSLEISRPVPDREVKAVRACGDESGGVSPWGRSESAGVLFGGVEASLPASFAAAVGFGAGLDGVAVGAEHDGVLEGVGASFGDGDDVVAFEAGVVA